MFAAGLLESEPRLLGLLSSKSALSPLVACITPAAASWPPLYKQAAAGAATGGPDASSSSMDAATLAETGEQLASLGLQLLLRATANAAVQEALTDEALLRQLYWLCVQPPSARVLNAALALLRRLSSSPLAASVGGYQGGGVMLMSVLLHTGRYDMTTAAGVEGSLMCLAVAHHANASPACMPSAACEQGAVVSVCVCTVFFWCLLLFLRRRWPWPGGDAAAADLSEATDAAKAAAADVLGALMAQPSHGPRVSLLMGKLLPPGLVASIAEGPPAAVLRALGQVRACICLYRVEAAC